MNIVVVVIQIIVVIVSVIIVVVDVVRGRNDSVNNRRHQGKEPYGTDGFRGSALFATLLRNENKRSIFRPRKSFLVLIMNIYALNGLTWIFSHDEEEDDHVVMPMLEIL